jgi:hypothetical protein
MRWHYLVLSTDSVIKQQTYFKLKDVFWDFVHKVPEDIFNWNHRESIPEDSGLPILITLNLFIGYGLVYSCYQITTSDTGTTESSADHHLKAKETS